MGRDLAAEFPVARRVFEEADDALGDKILSESFREQFKDAKTPLNGVKAGASQKPEDVDMITGATISSRTIIRGINKAVAKWSPLIAAYDAAGGAK